MKDADVRQYLTTDELRLFVAAELGQQPRGILDALREVARLRAALLVFEIDPETEQCSVCNVEATYREDGTWVVVEHADGCIFRGMPRPKRARDALFGDDPPED